MKIFTKRFVLLLIATFFYMLSLTMGNPIMAGFCASIGGSGVIMGLAGGILNICSLCCRPFAGGAVDRYNRRLLAIAGLSVMAVCNLGYCFTAAPMILILFRVLNGVGFALSSITLSTCVATSLPPQHIGTGMGIYGMVQAVSMAFAPTIALRLSDLYGYRLAFIAGGVFAVIALSIICFAPDTCITPEKDPMPISGPKQQLFAREVIPSAIVVLLVTLPYSALSAFIATFAKDSQLSVNVALYFPLYAAALIVSRVFLSRYFDRWNYRTFIVICAPFAAASLVSVNFMSTTLHMAIAAVLMALGYGVLVSVSQANGIKKVDASRHGIANSTYYIGLDMGLAAGPIIAGGLYSHFGSANLFLFLAAIPLFCFVVVLVKKKEL